MIDSNEYYIRHLRTCIYLASNAKERATTEYWYKQAKKAYNRTRHLEVIKKERMLKELNEFINKGD